MTNGDKVRAMTDNDLAELLDQVCCTGDDCYNCPADGLPGCGVDRCKDAFLSWLKEEVDNG